MGTPNFALLEEVADSTGFAGRYCDAIGMELWRSNGYHWHGFEIKASRADWLNERKDPSKAHAFKRYMDRWWLVVGDATIVKPGELPQGWGLLAPRGGQLVAKVQAPLLKPEPMPRGFLAAIMRRVVEQCVDAIRLQEAESRGRETGWAKARAVNDQLAFVVQRLVILRETARRIQESTPGLHAEPDATDMNHFEYRIRMMKNQAKDVQRIVDAALDGSESLSPEGEEHGE